MIVQLELNGRRLKADLRKPMDISMPLRAGENQLSAWYVGPVRMTPVRGDGFVGSVAEGGSVNFRDIYFNPHGHGTHTECVGHIAKKVHSLNETLTQFHFTAQLVSLQPEIIEGDAVLSLKPLLAVLGKGMEALVIRTLPNPKSKLTKAYSASNPPYLSKEAIELIKARGVKHLLIDLPSVDRENDGGTLTAHHIFWNYPAEENNGNTITELVYVPDEIPDDYYLLNLQMASFDNDASPSKPVLYALYD